VSEESSSAFLNDPERKKMKKNRMMNQEPSTPMRIPKIRASWMEPVPGTVLV
jgi:hypothetical protein